MKTTQRNCFKALKKMGFTLLELMITVLIIVVLTAIALPQYGRVVAKSRYKSMFFLAKSIYTAQESYFLTRGHYAQDVSDLGISFPDSSSSDVSFNIYSDNDRSYVLLTHKKLNNTLIVYNEHSAHFPGYVYCEAKADDNLATWLCEEEMDGIKIEDGGFTPGYISYVVKGGIDSLADVPPAPHDPVAYTNKSGNEYEYLTLAEGDTCTASDAQSCQYVDAHGAECTTSGNSGCAYSSFSDESTCNAGAQGGCFKSTFTDSSCVATVGGSNASSTSCGGEAIADSESHYIHSTCKNASGNGYACGRSTYEDHSKCTSNKYGGCGKSTFDNHSICEGNSGTACDESTFTNHSVCVANVFDACKKPKKYDSTSYCEGDYCPNGSPTKNGGTWCRESGWGKDKVSVVCSTN